MSSQSTSSSDNKPEQQQPKFLLGKDYSLVLWAGLKTPLVDEKGNLVKTTSAASPTLANDIRMSRSSFVPPPPSSSHTEEVLQYADDDDDIACCEVLESPMGLLDVLEQGRYLPPFESFAKNNHDDSDNTSKQQTEIPSHLHGIDSLFVMTPGNFASADFYIDFVAELRKLYPTLGILVLGHSGIQSSDRNHRVGYSLRHYVALNAHFIYEVALSRNAEQGLKLLASYGNQKTNVQQHQPDGEDVSSETSPSSSACSSVRHPKLILGAHSVGSYILLKALEQVTQVRNWLSHMNLIRVCFYAPVIQNFENAPAGDGAGKWVSKLGAGVISYGAVLPLWLLPIGARESIFEKFTGGNKEFAHKAAQMVRPSSVWNCLQLVRTAFREILDLEVDLLNGLGKKLYCYFVQNDGWVPDEYIDALRKGCPKVTIVMEPDETVKHSCCVTDPKSSAVALPFMENDNKEIVKEK